MADTNTGHVIKIEIDASAAKDALSQLEQIVDRLQQKIDALLASLENVKLKSDN